MELKGLVKDDLEQKGWVVREGILYGGDWLLYKNDQQGHTHAPFIVKVYTELPTYKEMLASIRVATQVKKSLLISFMENGTLEYYSIARAFN